MNALEVMMAAEKEANELCVKETKEVELKRWSKTFGKKIKFTLQAVGSRRLLEIQRQCTTVKKGNIKDVDAYMVQALTLIEGVKDPDLKNKQLLDMFGVATPKELINKIFNAGEVLKLFSEIQKLSGVDDDEDEETSEEKIKN